MKRSENKILKLIELSGTPLKGDLYKEPLYQGDEIRGYYLRVCKSDVTDENSKLLKPFVVEDETRNICLLQYNITKGDLAIYENQVVEVVTYYNEHFTLSSLYTNDKIYSVHIDDVRYKVVAMPKGIINDVILEFDLRDGMELDETVLSRMLTKPVE
jgi:hypothetical protein